MDPCGVRYEAMARRLLSPPPLTVGFQGDFLDLILRFHETLKRLQLQEAEYVLMAAMALFSPGKNHPKAKGLWPRYLYRNPRL